MEEQRRTERNPSSLVRSLPLEERKGDDGVSEMFSKGI